MKADLVFRPCEGILIPFPLWLVQSQAVKRVSFPQYPLLRVRVC